MKETQDTIAAWRRENFGPDIHVGYLAGKLLDEVGELLAETHAGQRFSGYIRDIAGIIREEVREEGGSEYRDGLRLEVADVAILLYGIAEVAGFDLHAAVDEKMAVNRARKWEQTPEGWRHR